MWIWIVEMWKYYEFLPHTEFIYKNLFLLKTFLPSTASRLLNCVPMLFSHVKKKIWAPDRFQTYKRRTKTKNGEKNFHLFYSLTKLTSILFLPFYSNIIKAVRMGREKGNLERESERGEKQFVTVNHCEKYVYVRYCMWCMLGERAQNEIFRIHVY